MNDALQIAFIFIAGVAAIGVFLPMPALGIKTRGRGFAIFCLAGLAAFAFARRQPEPASIQRTPLSPLNAFRQNVSDQIRAPVTATQDGFALSVSFIIPDNLTESLMAGSAKHAIAIMGHEALERGLAFTTMTVDASASMTDVYGRQGVERVIHAIYSRSTLVKVNWQNFDRDNIFRIADSSDVWPQFR